MFELLNKRVTVFLPDCQEGCSIRRRLAGLLLFLLVSSSLIEHNTEQHTCLRLTGYEMGH